MSRFSTMAEVTAEQVQRGRGPDPTAVARRKLVTREVKSVRERLTSSTGLERAFDNELLRVFAEYRMNGSVGTLVLALAIAAAACLFLLMLAMFPANIYASRMPDAPASMTSNLGVRSVEEVVYLAAAVFVAVCGG